MKALSIWEPSASLIRTTAKTFETRSRKTTYRGKLLICAASRGLPFYKLNHLMSCRPFQKGLAPLLGEPLDLSENPPTGFSVGMKHLNFGKAVAIADLVDCRPTDDLTLGEIEKEKFFGDFSPGRFAWKLANVQAIDPFPVKGKQGFFDVDYHPPCWLCGRSDPDTTMMVECETPGGKPCAPKTVHVHFGCYMNIEP